MTNRDEARLAKADDTCIGWAKYADYGGHPLIVFCDSNDSKAFKVYRHPEARVEELEEALRVLIDSLAFRRGVLWETTTRDVEKAEAALSAKEE